MATRPQRRSRSCFLGFALFMLAWFAVTVVSVGLWEADLLLSVTFGICLVLSVLQTPEAFRLWRGTVSHETLFSAAGDLPMSDEGTRAATPCFIIVLDGLTLCFAALVVPASYGVKGLLGVVGGTVIGVFLLLTLSVGWFRRPRFLMPKTMRRR